jgi:hypothetical protein
MFIHIRTTIGVVLVSLACAAQARPVLAQDDRIQKIEQRLNALEQRVAAANNSLDFIKVYLPAAFPILGIGLFCGLWARNSGRDFWLWFAAGLVFNIFALIEVLDAREKDQKAKRDAAKKASKEALDP